jgi:hypothetical protein
MLRSNVASVTAYIVNQAEHHKKFSSQEEIREILKRPREEHGGIANVFPF